MKIGKFPFSASGKARILGEEEGFVKIVGERSTTRFSACTSLEPHATELIAEACVAMQLESTAEELGRTMHAHPDSFRSGYGSRRGRARAGGAYLVSVYGCSYSATLTARGVPVRWCCKWKMATKRQNARLHAERSDGRQISRQATDPRQVRRATVGRAPAFQMRVSTKYAPRNVQATANR